MTIKRYHLLLIDKAPLAGQFNVWTTLCLVLAFSLCGCMSEWSEEERHLEHFVPPHKPANYAAAVDQLETRGDDFLDGKSSNEQFDELWEIIGWLPELAGNSDLLRPQWEQVQSISNTLAAINTGDSGKSLDEADRQSWQENLGQLKELVPLAGKPEKAL